MTPVRKSAAYLCQETEYSSVNCCFLLFSLPLQLFSFQPDGVFYLHRFGQQGFKAKQHGHVNCVGPGAFASP